MARARGANAIMAAAYESTYGTVPGSGFKKLPFVSADIGEDQALISVLNEHDARLKIREAVRPRANITARHAQGCGLDGLFR